MNILVTGANGFVGQSLIEKLLERGHHVTALVRSKAKLKKSFPTVKWIEGDLLKPLELPELKEIDKAYYLVHGLKGEESHFEYQESRAAVNFVNWIKPTRAGIIYLGGLGPHSDSLSPHLRSRHLTGAILGSALSLVEFRASIILGEGSLSFEMIKALSHRLPFKPQMNLLSQPCQPLALDDLLKYLVAAAELPSEGHMIYEIGGPDVTTYGELIELYMELEGITKRTLPIPDVGPKVLMKILDYAIPELSQMGRKLTESLEHPTVVTSDAAQKDFPDIRPMDLRTAMEIAREESQSSYSPLLEKEFIKTLLTDKILAQSAPLVSELLRNLEKVGKLRDILTRK
jgi:uncharacterized protein YbjT (DUF2867 family)